MNLRTTLLAGSIPALLVLASTTSAFQDKAKMPAQGGKDAHADMMAMLPKPTKEHEWLKGRVGTWDCTVNAMGAKSKGTETCKMLGDFWQISDFTGDFMGTPFFGHGTMTFDPMKQKYVGTWADSMAPMLIVMEGTADASGKKLTMKGMSLNMEGKMAEATMITEIKGPDEALFTMYESDKGANSPTAMTIEYKRRK
ncbi:MAG TPA: DUF1579 domain-containing protein [Planctomycetota bacterium]|nr:DUF1579 domain-containing protein [Planctomycetota bacterium]